MRILVVDDDADSRWLICQRLRRSDGWEVVDRSDAYQALVELRHATFDVVVLDHMMPGATGLDLVARLSATNIDVPVVLVTSMVPGPLRAAALRAGVAAVVAKEDVEHALLPAIEQAILGSERSGEPTAG